MKANSGNVDAQETQGPYEEALSCLDIRSIESAGHFGLRCDWTTYRLDI
jgi:hypothetical protein